MDDALNNERDLEPQLPSVFFSGYTWLGIPGICECPVCTVSLNIFFPTHEAMLSGVYFAREREKRIAGGAVRQR